MPHTWPLCNRDPASAPRWGGRCAPLCWRCIALSGGILAAAALQFQPPAWLALAMIAPCVLDGALRYGLGLPGDNRLRIASGLPAGIGLHALAAPYSIF